MPEKSEFNPDTYSREAYERIEKLIESLRNELKIFDRDRASYLSEAGEHEVILNRTHSQSRKNLLDRSYRGVKKSETKIENASSRINQLQAKLKELYELAHEEALKENQKFNLEKLESA